MLTREQKFDIANKVAEAYANAFSRDTIMRATVFTEGQRNQSRNYMFSIILNTKTKKGTIVERYGKEDATEIAKLAIYRISQPSVQITHIDI